PGLVRLSSKSLEASPPFHSRNNCIVPRTLVNTNNMLGFKNLDVDLLLKEEGKRIFYDILSGKIEEDPTLLLRFLVISFVDLKNWKVYYDVAFPSLVLNSKMTFLRLHSASEVLSQEELLFGFYDHGHQDYPGWALRNYIAFLSLRWKIEKVQFLCYRERRGEPDLEKSLIGEASFAAPHGWDGSDYVPEIIGWEGEKAGDRKKEKILKPIDLDSLNPASQDEEKQVMHLKLMGWRHPSLVLNKLRSARCLVLGAGALGCEVSRLLMTWGVRKLTVVDGGCVAIPDIVKQSLYVDNDCGVPRATAIVPHLKERCPAVEVEGIQMEIPVPGNPVSKTKMSSVLDNCKRLQALVASSDVVFLLTDTWESRWFPTLLCANENKVFCLHCRSLSLQHQDMTVTLSCGMVLVQDIIYLPKMLLVTKD
uniref:THIF-type NAD/FAD binding fold domain-containing protein n=1 Tax=Aegilops tauschii subsp. strangulata TaxID=200361 RepID=A0A453BZ75_AEGTS